MQAKRVENRTGRMIMTREIFLISFCLSQKEEIVQQIPPIPYNDRKLGYCTI